MSALAQLRARIKRRDTAFAKAAYAAATAVRDLEMPVVRPFHQALYAGWNGVKCTGSWLTRVLLWTPMFKSRLDGPAPKLFLYGGMPLVMGPLKLSFGRGCRVSAASTLTGRCGSAEQPVLTVGDNVDIGWQTTIAVGRSVEIGDNVRIAGRAFLAGYPGHPVDAFERAKGLPDTEDQIGDIVLENDVWLATGVTVLAGVTIGAGTIVAAGSVVTRSLPPGVLAAGVPARVVKTLDPKVRRLSA